MSYKIFEWRIRPKTSFLSKLHSDTIWGHIVWAIRYIEGEEAVIDILNKFKKGRPPFIVSNGFLSNYLPFIKKAHVSNMFNIKHLETKEMYNKENKVKFRKLLEDFESIDYVNTDVFNEMREKSIFYLYNEIIEGNRCPVTLRKYDAIDDSLRSYLNNRGEYINKYRQYDKLTKSVSVMRNRINRLTNTSEQEDGAGVYTTYETFYDSPVSIYFKIEDDFDLHRFEKYLKYIEISGFGKKASSGKGHFITEYFKERNDVFRKSYMGNGYIILSNYIPKKEDYEEVIYSNIINKRGKVSGLYGNRENVFKKPFLCYGEGSIFKGSVNDKKGRMLDGIYHDETVIQYGIPFIVGVNIDE